MIIVDKMPFSIIEMMKFKKLFRVIEPRFKLHSHYIVMEDCIKLYIRNKKTMRTKFFTTSQMVYLTTNT